MDFTALQDFNLVAKHGGFSNASRASARPKATLSRHVMQLETSLGMRLLERDGRAFRLTEEGQILFARTQGLMAEITEISRELMSGQANPHGTLHVNVPFTFGQMAMGRLAAQFARRYPDVRLQVTVDDKQVALIQDGFDVVIRVNPKLTEELVGRCFYRDHFVIVAAPSVPKPTFNDTANLKNVPTIVSLQAPNNAVWKMTALDNNAPTIGRQKQRQSHADVVEFVSQPMLRLPNPLMIKDAVLTGAGVAMLAKKLVNDALSDGRLVCWGSVPDRPVEIWVLHTSRRLVSSKVAAFVTFLCENFEGVENGLAGNFPQSNIN